MEYINKGKNGEIILTDGKNEGAFEFLEMLVLNGDEYAVLLEEGDDMITIMKFTEAQGRNPEKYSEIEDDEIFDRLLFMYEEDNED